MMTRRALLGMLFLTGFAGLTGCATSPKTQYYGLTAAPSQGITYPTRNGTVGIGPITLAPYLDTERIAVREQSERIELDEFHRWAGRLDQELQKHWAEQLSMHLPNAHIYEIPNPAINDYTYRVVVDVAGFDAIRNEGAQLNVQWTIIDGMTNKPVLMQRQRYLTPLAKYDMDSIVRGLNQVATQFSQELAGQLAMLSKLRVR